MTIRFDPNSMITVGKLKRTLDLMGVPDDMPFVVETMNRQVCEVVEIRNDPDRGSMDVLRIVIKPDTPF